MDEKQCDMKEMRQSYWSEIDEKEKCQRLRIMVKCLQQQVQALENLAHQLCRHEHSPAGYLVVALQGGPMEARAFGGRHSEEHDDVYF